MRVPIALALLFALTTPGRAQAPSAEELARQVQTHYNRIQDFAADFTMTYQGALLRQKATERGDVRLKKPNRMWWRYAPPDRKEYVADGSRLYQHFPQDKIVIQTELPKASDTSTSLLFLAGKGDLLRDFTPALSASQPAGEWHLILTPRAKQADFQTLTLIVDRRTLDLRGMKQETAEGTHTFAFSRFRSNLGLKDSDFVFTIPKGTEIR